MTNHVPDAVLRQTYADHLRALTTGYDAALATAGLDGVLIDAGRAPLRHPADDQHVPFTPTPAFLHWLPLPEPGCVLLYRAADRPKLLRPAHGGFWSGPAPVTADHALPHFEVIETDGSIEGLRKHLRPGERLAFIGAGDTLGQALDLHTDATRDQLVAAVERLRAHKSAYEQQAIAAANRIAARGHRAVARAFDAGERRELHLHLSYLAATDQDATQTPYANIVALGAHAAVLHHAHYATTAADADTSMLVDAGAQHLGYHADITRTRCGGHGHAVDAFSALVAGLDALQLGVAGAVRPGVPFEALHELAHDRLAELLVELGVGRASPEALVQAGVTRALFPHGLGHSLGLQTHDVGCRPVSPQPDNPYLRHTETLTPGQVVTIEPGCYFIGPLLAPLRAGPHAGLLDWTWVDALSPLGGVRIEDDVLVTATGADNLTRAAFAVEAGPLVA